MIVTEEAAEKLWCPFARPGVNRGKNNAFCVGSKCMAWQPYGSDEERRGYCSIGIPFLLTPKE